MVVAASNFLLQVGNMKIARNVFGEHIAHLFTLQMVTGRRSCLILPLRFYRIECIPIVFPSHGSDNNQTWTGHFG